ncbi:VOC family protein [Neolewinella aurantiaca]|uniref:VOC family protein n=1 Tax=Neolewinella aurantiaca TaxID=2602767 RepID=A0A5C7FUB6_9BACT|nr:VOC family protein [Neolewinella aurantiaca]TXF89914.1 VOC family protein [Neolewinella aurantiaca]
MRKTDHIVYTVPDLDAAVTRLETLLGVKPLIGGRHETQGTKNALVNLSDGAYLEILAADDTNTVIPPPRWMGVDVLSRPRVTRWAIKSDDLRSDAKILLAHNPELGKISAGSRQRPDGSTLRWELVLPAALPEVDVIPFMVDWSTSDIHPHDALPDMGCRIVEVQLYSPEPENVQPVLEQLGVEVVALPAKETMIKVVLNTPSGEVVL